MFGVPTILTTVVEERGGHLLQGLQDVFPEQKPINRTFINTWEDSRVVDAVKATGRKKLIIAGLYTEICVAMPAIQALEDGYTVYVVTDASGGTTREAHDMAVQRMIQAGMVPITSGVVLAEFQRDWAREATVAGLAASWDSTAAAARSRSPGKCSCSTPPPLPPQAREWQPAAQERGRCTQHRPASITACCRT